MKLTAVLLVGGESLRMGREKATLLFEGRPLWQRQIECLRALRPETILISARTTPSWLPPDAEIVLDQPPSCGPLSGIAAALARTRTSHLVVLAVDMPFVTVPLMRRLHGRAARGRGVVPVHGERAEPLAAIYPSRASDAFAGALVGENWSMQTLARRLAAAGRVEFVAIPEEEIGCYRSLNEPGDLGEV